MAIDKNNSRDAAWRVELRGAMSAKDRAAIERVKMPELDPAVRVASRSAEVNLGISEEQAVAEATRCMDCPDPQCVTGCPVGIDIPGFIKNIQRGDFAEASAVLRLTSALPAVCGRVCPQEKQCESRCIYHRMKRQPVAIGYLERFAADRAREEARKNPVPPRRPAPALSRWQWPVAVRPDCRLPAIWPPAALTSLCSRLCMRSAECLSMVFPNSVCQTPWSTTRSVLWRLPE